MLKDLWRVLTGRLSWELLSNARYALQRAVAEADFQRKRATEAVRLYNESEVARKQSSDALGEAVINQLKGQA